jgi:hypothetical protein
VEFKPSEHGLHYLDMTEHGDSIQHMLVTANGDHKDEDSEDKEEGNEDEESNNLVMVNTVRKNFEGFTKHEIKMAQEARRLQGMIGNPTDRNSPEWCVKNLLPTAQSLCMMSKMLTKFLVLTLLTSGAR